MEEHIARLVARLEDGEPDQEFFGDTIAVGLKNPLALVEGLRQSAALSAGISEMLADADPLRDTGCRYHGVRPEETLEWLAAGEIERLWRRRTRRCGRSSICRPRPRNSRVRPPGCRPYAPRAGKHDRGRYGHQLARPAGSGASLAELQNVISELQHLHDFLRSEGERIQREVSTYVQLSQTAIGSTRTIADNIVHWKEMAVGTAHALERRGAETERTTAKGPVAGGSLDGLMKVRPVHRSSSVVVERRAARLFENS